MVKFRDRLLDIVERHYEGKMTVGGMMDAFDEVIAEIEASSVVAAPLAQDAFSDENRGVFIRMLGDRKFYSLFSQLKS